MTKSKVKKCKNCKVTGLIPLITGFDNSNDEYLAKVNGAWWMASDLFEDFPFIDGTPCGVKE